MKIVLLLLCYFLACNAIAQPGISKEVSHKIDAYMAYIMQEQQIPGAAVAILQDAVVLKKSSYGLASVEYRVPVSDSSMFWLASVSKHITATAIMQLIEQGVIKLDESIKNYLPDIPASWESITIRHLLTHTSGLPGSGKGNERGHRSAAGTLSAEQMFANAKKDSLSFPPGEQFQYSDEGIFLLGYIIHRISGTTFKEYMRKHIFQPAHMSTAYLMDQFTIHPNQVTGYAIRNGKLSPDRNSWRLIDTEINAAGGVYASINDMIAWEKAMRSDDIISAASKQQMWTSARLNKGCETAYGFAWNSQTNQQGQILYHPGIAGTEYLRFVNKGLTIIVLTNQADLKGSIALELASFQGIPTAIPVSAYTTGKVVASNFTNDELASLTGEYEFTGNENYYFGKGFRRRVRIETVNNELFINYQEAKPFPKRYQLAKLQNGRLAELSWFPVLIEISYVPKADGSIEVYENYACDEQLHIGTLRGEGLVDHSP